jgi:multiple sugar transport system ATP-binding protein
MASVTLEGVRKIYAVRGGSHTAVHGISLDIADGEFVVLVGPSGCGKSTTLRMIAGLESPTAGEIRIGARRVNDEPPKDRDIAMVFQNYALYPHMTARENMVFALRLRKQPAEEIERRVHEAAAMLGIEPLLPRTPKQMSGGERQRVALGRALVRHPSVFLFDEPLSNLDAKLRVQLRREIGRLHRRLSATMIYVTHDQVEAMTLGDRIVVMQAGHVQQVASPAELYSRPANVFVAGFIGSPPMNLLPGTVDGATVVLDGGAGTVPAGPGLGRGAAAGTRLVLGVRPEDLGRSAGEPDGPGLDFQVDSVEPLGHEVLVGARAGTVEMVARMPPRPVPAPGDRLRLLPDPKRLHFFLEATGQRMEGGSGLS